MSCSWPISFSVGVIDRHAHGDERNVRRHGPAIGVRLFIVDCCTDREKWSARGVVGRGRKIHVDLEESRRIENVMVGENSFSKRKNMKLGVDPAFQAAVQERLIRLRPCPEMQPEPCPPQ
jgi:hypothetical protein